MTLEADMPTSKLILYFLSLVAFLVTNNVAVAIENEGNLSSEIETDNECAKVLTYAKYKRKNYSPIRFQTIDIGNADNSEVVSTLELKLGMFGNLAILPNDNADLGSISVDSKSSHVESTPSHGRTSIVDQMLSALDYMQKPISDDCSSLEKHEYLSAYNFIKHASKFPRNVRNGEEFVYSSGTYKTHLLRALSGKGSYLESSTGNQILFIYPIKNNKYALTIYREYIAKKDMSMSLLKYEISSPNLATLKDLFSLNLSGS